MGANRRIIIGMTLTAISAVASATLTIAMAEPSASVDGTFYAAVPPAQHLSLERKNSTLQPSISSGVTPIRDIQADRVVSGSEPDPEMFDRAGLESWWRRHQRAAK